MRAAFLLSPSSITRGRMGASKAAQPPNLLKVRHIHNSLSVSTGFVPWSRWDSRKFCGVTPVVGIGGLLERSRAPADFLRDVTICFPILNQVARNTNFKGTIWNFAVFASTIKMRYKKSMLKTKNNKAYTSQIRNPIDLFAKVWRTRVETVWKGRIVPKLPLDSHYR